MWTLRTQGLAKSPAAGGGRGAAVADTSMLGWGTWEEEQDITLQGAVNSRVSKGTQDIRHKISVLHHCHTGDFYGK